MPPRAVFSIITVMLHCEPERKRHCTAEKQNFDVLHSSLAKQPRGECVFAILHDFVQLSSVLEHHMCEWITSGTTPPSSPLVPVNQMQ